MLFMILRGEVEREIKPGKGGRDANEGMAAQTSTTEKELGKRTLLLFLISHLMFSGSERA